MTLRSCAALAPQGGQTRRPLAFVYMAALDDGDQKSCRTYPKLLFHVSAHAETQVGRDRYRLPCLAINGLRSLDDVGANRTLE